MWLILAFLSAFLLGFYDVFKKVSLSDNAVIPVLFLNTLFSSLLFLPFIILSQFTTYLDDTIFHVSTAGWAAHKFIVLKSFIVLGSWVCGYFAMKHLPLTIVGPINATRPVPGFGRRHVGVWRNAQPLSMGGCAIGNYVVLPFE